MAFERTVGSTVLVCADGLGSGVKANVAATMCVHRVLEHLRRGTSMRKACLAVARTMEAARGGDLPYAVFSAVRILSDGKASIFTYEIPPPIVVGQRHAAVLPQRSLNLVGSQTFESHCHLRPGEGVVVVSDGITQAGLGLTMRHGWGIEGVCEYVNDRLAAGASLRQIPGYVHDRARELWDTVRGDDCTVAVAACRFGKSLTIFSGPPLNPREDREIVNRFLRMEGTKVVCGATTADIVAHRLGKEVEVEQQQYGAVSPPRYSIEGIDLVTEGAVTLNMVYNILDEDPAAFVEESGVTELYELLQTADKVHFIIGGAKNPAHTDIVFRQRGILPRTTIIPLIGQKLEEAGKLVLFEHV